VHLIFGAPVKPIVARSSVVLTLVVVSPPPPAVVVAVSVATAIRHCRRIAVVAFS